MRSLNIKEQFVCAQTTRECSCKEFKNIARTAEPINKSKFGLFCFYFMGDKYHRFLWMTFMEILNSLAADKCTYVLCIRFVIFLISTLETKNVLYWYVFLLFYVKVHDVSQRPRANGSSFVASLLGQDIGMKWCTDDFGDITLTLSDNFGSSGVRKFCMTLFQIWKPRETIAFGKK